LQGDRESDGGGYAISPLCDRHTTSVAASQVGYAKFIVEPTFHLLFRVDEEMHEHFTNLKTFRAHWEKELAGSYKKMREELE